MESNERYYARRAVEELRAVERAVTPEAKARRLALAEAFQLKCQAERMLSSPPRPMNSLPEASAAASLSPV
jgi:hypothetical protein